MPGIVTHDRRNVAGGAWTDEANTLWQNSSKQKHNCMRDRSGTERGAAIVMAGVAKAEARRQATTSQNIAEPK